MGRVALRVALVAGIVVALGVVPVAPAAAHGGEESDRASDLVLQAIALMVNEPGNRAAAAEKIHDALEAKSKKGVNLADVEDADKALEGRDVHRARALLERSLGAEPHLSSVEPNPIRETSEQPAKGAEPGTKTVLDALPGRGAFDTGDVLVLIAALAVAALGVWLAYSFRPRTKA